jgi:hypothetical protein
MMPGDGCWPLRSPMSRSSELLRKACAIVLWVLAGLFLVGGLLSGWGAGLALGLVFALGLAMAGGSAWGFALFAGRSETSRSLASAGLWIRYRSWPRWLQIVVPAAAVFVAAGLVSLRSGSSKTAAPPIVVTPASVQAARTTRVRAATKRVRAAPVVPTAVAVKIRSLAGQAAYLPVFLPEGYRYTRWKRGVARGKPHDGQEWFLITFRTRSNSLVWGVTVESKKTASLPCGSFAAGHASFGGRTAYWSEKGTQAAKRFGVKTSPGRNFWTCRELPAGGALLILFSSSDETLPVTEGARIAATSAIGR